VAVTSHRIVALCWTALAVLGGAAGNAHAQQPSLVDRPGPVVSQEWAGSSGDNPEETVTLPSAATAFKRERPSALLPLYVGFAGLQVYDLALTLKGVSPGASTREANPVAARFAQNGLAITALKGATTASTILLTERLWKRRRGAAAVAVMTAVDVAMAAVVAHNQRVLR
jgi:hypothetical protein